MPIEVKPCPFCGREPEQQMVIFHLPTFEEDTIMRRFSCPRCKIAGKPCVNIADAVEAWNRMVDDGK